ncbi:unnamed protein product [Calypogeia fissa]
MSQKPLASRLSNLEIADDYDVQGERQKSSLIAVHRHEACNGDTADSARLKEGETLPRKPTKREFCKRCDKAASLCICHHVKTLVDNKTSIIILQHPEEKRHHLGSARIALLGLQNVEIISLPEVDEPVSYRIREQVPGSKRFLTGRGGKKAPNVKEELKKKKLVPKIQQAVTSPSEQELESQHSPNLASGEGSPLVSESASISVENRQLVHWSSVPPWINLHPDAGLLFPSEKALDLWPAGSRITNSSDCVLYFESKVGDGERLPSNSPSQLIVLDGTWSKAKRIYFENPWLHSLPHYRLPTLQDSRYGRLRREPKPGFLSTIESIVLALQLLEPETHGLESLLSVFDSMIEDQMRFVQKKK